MCRAGNSFGIPTSSGYRRRIVMFFKLIPSLVAIGQTKPLYRPPPTSRSCHLGFCCCNGKFLVISISPHRWWPTPTIAGSTSSLASPEGRGGRQTQMLCKECRSQRFDFCLPTYRSLLTRRIDANLLDSITKMLLRIIHPRIYYLQFVGILLDSCLRDWTTTLITHRCPRWWSLVRSLVKMRMSTNVKA